MRSAIALSRGSHSGGGTIIPPAPRIVSVMIAATSPVLTRSVISSLAFTHSTSHDGYLRPIGER